MTESNLAERELIFTMGLDLLKDFGELVTQRINAKDYFNFVSDCIASDNDRGFTADDLSMADSAYMCARKQLHTYTKEFIGSFEATIKSIIEGDNQ